MRLSSLLSSLVLTLSPCVSATPALRSLKVTTTSGTLSGFNPDPSVRAFLGIPYAQPPVGPLRFAPPEPLLVADKRIVREASSFGKTCFQYRYKTIGFEKRGPTTGESEDCLTLNVWGPAKMILSEGGKALPVLVWITGGGFGEGATSDFSYDPLDLIKTHQDILLVSINYRLNVFGFPLTPALPENSTNLGIRDQRLAIEWLRDNIHSFGGDPAKMTLFGQSAGSTSLAVHSFWHPDDPIVRAMILQSGQAEVTLVNTPDQWDTVSKAAGCASKNRTKELQCMQNLDALELRNAVSVKPNNYFSIDPIGGSITVDNKTFLTPQEYIALGMQGKFAKISYLIGSTNNEGDGIVPFDTVQGFNRTFADDQTLAAYTCITAVSAGYRAASKVPVWRYRYMGSFPWQTNFKWIKGRAPHGSELGLLFGSYWRTQYQDLTSNDLEAVRLMQKLWVTFAKDPTAGLSSLGWPRYNPKEKTLAELLPNNTATFKIVDPNKYDAPCANVTSVDTSGYKPYC